MPLTMQDLPTLIVLLEEAPEVRARLRSLLDLDELKQVPDRLDRIESILDQLAEAQLQSEARLDRLEATVQELAEAQKRTDERIAELIAAQKRTDERIAELIAAQKRTDERIAELIAAQKRTDERIDMLIEAQQRTEERLLRLEETVEKLTNSLIGIQRTTDKLVEWQRGEEGRRAGEAYERQILRRAANLFNLGEGGSPESSDVARHLRGLLQSNPLVGVMSPEQDPFLADILWWKGNQYAVTEVSVQVDSNDVRRAVRRAETLRGSGVDAIPVVIGEEWANSLSEKEATESAVVYKIGNEMSPGLITYRRLPL